MLKLTLGDLGLADIPEPDIYVISNYLIPKSDFQIS